LFIKSKFNSKSANIDDVQCSIDITDVTHPGLCAEEVTLGAVQID